MTASQTACKPPRKRPGLKPGQKHSGSFKRGYDPRRIVQTPSETISWQNELSALCREHSPAAVKLLVKIMRDEDATHTTRLEAIEKLFSYGYGKPLDRQATLVLTQPQGQAQDGKPIAQMSSTELDQLEASALTALQALAPPKAEGEGDIIEAEIVPEGG